MKLSVLFQNSLLLPAKYKNKGTTEGQKVVNWLKLERKTINLKGDGMSNSITLTGIQVSDLFFNHQNVNYSLAIEYDLPLEEAVRKDAEGFAELIGGQVEVESLVKDFMGRL